MTIDLIEPTVFERVHGEGKEGNKGEHHRRCLSSAERSLFPVSPPPYHSFPWNPSLMLGTLVQTKRFVWLEVITTVAQTLSGGGSIGSTITWRD